MQKYILVILMILTSSSTILADNSNDIEAINETAKNYMESWYQGDAKKMKECLHDELAKRSLQFGSDNKKELRLISASGMVSYTKSGYGKSLWTNSMEIEVVVLDFHKNIASVKVITSHYYEYLHLVKTDNKWEIVNTLYDRN